MQVAEWNLTAPGVIHKGKVRSKPRAGGVWPSQNETRKSVRRKT